MTDSKIALVTGARRGVGAGIAGDLGSHGIVIYITGRSLNASDAIARAAYDKTCYRASLNCLLARLSERFTGKIQNHEGN